VPTFSPDGNWLAYVRRGEVIVSSFPERSSTWQVSMNGGQYPRWIPKTNELVFQDPTGQLMSTSYTTQGKVFSHDTPRPWVSVRMAPFNSRLFDIASADRFVFLAPPASQTHDARNTIGFIFNFPEMLRTIAPVK
jgi:hypothetical protein